MARTYYVSDGTGVDTNNGTLDAPLKTITRAIALAATGDTVSIRGGTYFERVNITKGLTVTGYAGETAIIDGEYVLPNTNGAATYYKSAYLSASTTGGSNPRENGRFHTWEGLLEVAASNVTVSNITIKNSLGRGVRIYKEGSVLSTITLDGVNVDGARDAAYVTYNSSNVTIKNAEAQDIGNVGVTSSGEYVRGVGGSLTAVATTVAWVAGQPVPRMNWPAAISAHGTVRNLTIDNIKLHEVYAAGIDLNSTGTDVQYVTVTNCTLYDIGMETFDVHAMAYFTYTNNIIYAGSTNVFGVIKRGNAFYIQPAEANFSNPPIPDTGPGLIANNLIIGMSNALFFGGEENAINAGRRIKDVKVLHNTVIANGSGQTCAKVLWAYPHVMGAGCEIRNNIFYAYGGATLVGNTLGTQVAHTNNYWSAQPAATWSGTNDVVGGSLNMVAPTASTETSVVNISNYKVASDSNTVNAGYNTLADVATDFWGTARDTTPTIGFYEYGAAGPSLSVDFTITSTPTTVNTSVAFNATASAANGATADRYAWTFGDGSNSTSEDPSHTYSAVGTYTVSCTVYDDDLILQYTKTKTVSVSPAAGASPVAVEVVDFQVGDASFAVTATPKLILFLSSGAIADDTITNHGRIGIGAWYSGGSAAYGNYASSGQSPTLDRSRGVADSSVLYVDSSGATSVYASVSSVTASAVNLSWTGTGAAERITAMVFSGSALDVSGIELVAQTVPPTTLGLAGNLVIAITSIGGLVNQTFSGMSLGFAYKDGSGTVSQAAAAWYTEGGTAAGDVYASVRNNAAFDYVRSWEKYSQISWTGNYPVVTSPQGATIWTARYIVCTVNPDVVGVQVGTDVLPTSGTPVDVSLGFDPGSLLMALTTVPTGTNRVAAGANASSYAVYMTDGTSERTVAISSQHGANPSVEKSRTADQLLLTDSSGAVLADGTVTLGTGKFTVDLATADATARRYAYIAFESTSGAGLPTAGFSYTTDEGVARFGSNVYFTDLSDATGGAISAWSWKNNGVEFATTQNPTWVPDYIGQASVTLTVTNAEGNSTTTPREFDIAAPLWDIMFWGSPMRKGTEIWQSATVADEDTFSHQHYGVIDFTVDSLADASGAIDVKFRAAGADDYWRLEIDDAGDMALFEATDASEESRDTAAGAVEDGDAVSIFLEGPTVSVRVNDTEILSYTQVLDPLETEKSGEVLLDTGAVVSGLTTYTGMIYAALGEDFVIGASLPVNQEQVVTGYWFVIRRSFSDTSLDLFYRDTSRYVTVSLPSAEPFRVEGGITYDLGGESIDDADLVRDAIYGVIATTTSANFVDLNGGGVVLSPYTARFEAQYYDSVLYAWDFDDGSAEDTTSGWSVEHEYSDPGTYEPSLTITTEFGETSTVSYTHAPIVVGTIPNAPMTQAELVTALASVYKMLGVITDTWVVEDAPNANVYAVALTDTQWADGMSVRVFEDGVALTVQAGVAAAQASAGSCYASYAAGTLTVYVHPTGSGNPNTNGKEYRWLD